MREMQAALHTDRSVMALASALVWIGNGVAFYQGFILDNRNLQPSALGDDCPVVNSRRGNVCLLPFHANFGLADFHGSSSES